MSTTTTMRSAVALSREYEDQMLRQATAHMKRGIRRMPKGYQDFFRDLTRKEPRSKSFFRHIPRVADAMAEAGAQLCDVVAPLHAEEARIVAKHYAHRLPSVEEAGHAETNANNLLNHLQLEAERQMGKYGKISPELATSIQEAASVQRSCSDVYAAVVLRDSGR